MARNIDSANQIYGFLKENVPGFNKEVEFHNIGSEDYCGESVNFAFSSPPYFNLEVYENNSKQAGSRSYIDFLNLYWKPTIQNIDKMLVKGGKLALNITDKTINSFSVGQDMCNVIKDMGYTEINKYNIQLTKNLNFNNKSNSHKYEPIYIFEKI